MHNDPIDVHIYVHSVSEQLQHFKTVTFHTVVQQGFKKWQDILYLFYRLFIVVFNSERIFKIGWQL